MCVKEKSLNYSHFLLSAALCLSAAGLVFFGKAATDGAKRGMLLCADILIPSIFPFMCVCSIISESGGGAVISKLLRYPSKLFFPGLSDFSYIYIMSLLGGYPFAASFVGPLCDSGRLSEKGAKMLLLFCFSPTPAFCITAIGQGLYGSAVVGTVIYISCLLSSLLLAAAVCRIGRYQPISKPKPDRSRNFSEAFVFAMNSACRSVITVCATVIFSSSLVSVISEAAKSPFISALLTCLCEITSAVEYSTKNLPVFVTAAIVSFGGLVTFVQTAALSGNLFPRFWLFLVCRISCAILSSGICAGFLKLFKIPLAAFCSRADGFSAALSCNPVPAVFLVLCALTLLIWMGQTKNPFNLKEKL